jgi:hypothetical protein
MVPTVVVATTLYPHFEYGVSTLGLRWRTGSRSCPDTEQCLGLPPLLLGYTGMKVAAQSGAPPDTAIRGIAEIGDSPLGQKNEALFLVLINPANSQVGGRLPRIDIFEWPMNVFLSSLVVVTNGRVPQECARQATILHAACAANGSKPLMYAHFHHERVKWGR